MTETLADDQKARLVSLAEKLIDQNKAIIVIAPKPPPFTNSERIKSGKKRKKRTTFKGYIFSRNERDTFICFQGPVSAIQHAQPGIFFRPRFLKVAYWALLVVLWMWSLLL